MYERPLTNRTHHVIRGRQALPALGLLVALALLLSSSAMTQTKPSKSAKPVQSTAAPASAQQKGANPAGQVVTVRITHKPGTATPITVDPNSVKIGKDDEVKWECEGNCDFHVVFPDPNRKPFASQHFHSGNPQSGKPTSVPPPGKTKKYKYTVTVKSDAIDPDVIIKGGG